MIDAKLDEKILMRHMIDVMVAVQSMRQREGAERKLVKANIIPTISQSPLTQVLSPSDGT